MKKYMTPDMEVVDLRLQIMLCTSVPVQQDEESQPEMGGGGGSIMP